MTSMAGNQGGLEVTACGAVKDLSPPYILDYALLGF